MDYFQTLRIEGAKQLLERCRHPVDDIGAEVGYRDPASLRRLLKRLTGLTPAACRRRFDMPRL
jgi:transcriptional regulator GlxA family with amidase domain